METLSKLFGGDAKVRILRLFLFNPNKIFSASDIASHSKVPVIAVRHTVAILKKIDMVRGKRFTHTAVVKKNKKSVLVRKSEGGWILNTSFPFLVPLQDLLINTVLVRYADVIRRLNSAGKIKLVIVSGLFIKDEESRVDLLVVGDMLRMATLENVIKNIESEIGKELRYAAFDTEDFKYRLGMHDKLVRDVLDYPHKVILDKLSVSFKA